MFRLLANADSAAVTGQDPQFAILRSQSAELSRVADYQRTAYVISNSPARATATCTGEAGNAVHWGGEWMPPRSTSGNRLNVSAWATTGRGRKSMAPVFVAGA